MTFLSFISDDYIGLKGVLSSMKFVLILSMCSYVSGACLPPYEWPEKFNSGYECSIADYEEAAKKLKEIGPVEVDKYRVSITFTCNGVQET